MTGYLLEIVRRDDPWLNESPAIVWRLGLPFRRVLILTRIGP